MTNKYDYNEALKLNNQLCFPLYSAARKITSAYTPYLSPLNLTYTQYIVFMVLWEKDNITVNEISERLLLDTGTISPVLKKMEQNSYLTRNRNKEDERQVIISLTDKGKKMKEKCKNIPLQLANNQTLTPEEGKQLYELLYKFLELK